MADRTPETSEHWQWEGPYPKCFLPPPLDFGPILSLLFQAKLPSFRRQQSERCPWWQLKATQPGLIWKVQVSSSVPSSPTSRVGRGQHFKVERPARPGKEQLRSVFLQGQDIYFNFQHWDSLDPSPHPNLSPRICWGVWFQPDFLGGDLLGGGLGASNLETKHT